MQQCPEFRAGAVAILMHPAKHTRDAGEMAQYLSGRVPAALVSTLPLDGGCGGGTEGLEAAVADTLRRAGVCPNHLVLASFFGAEDMAMRLVFGERPFPCAGLLVCGDAPLPLAPLSVAHTASPVKLRLVWSRPDALAGAAALRGLLQCFRMAGIDAKGAVVGAADEGGSARLFEDGFPTPAARFGCAYFVELMAFAAATPFGRPPYRCVEAGFPSANLGEIGDA